MGPLHPLPILDKCRDSVTIDFIRPLPVDKGFDMVCSMTNCLGLDIQLVPTVSTLTANGMALLFFDHWFFNNGLPTDDYLQLSPTVHVLVLEGVTQVDWSVS